MLIGVRAIKFVTKELKLRRILWPDSQCMLHWLKTKKPLSVFIENHIEEIKSEKDVIFAMLLQITTLQLLLLEVSQYRISCVLRCSGIDHPGFKMMIHCGQHGIFLMLLLKPYSKWRMRLENQNL